MIRGRLVGIDHGMKRIGLAISDPSWLVAHEIAVIRRRTRAADFERINQLSAEHDAVGFVVGLPLNRDANSNTHSQADTVRRWVERFRATATLPIILWDEGLSSADALVFARMQRRKSRDPIDDLAARVILQSYLDAVRDGLVEPLLT